MNRPHRLRCPSGPHRPPRGPHRRRSAGPPWPGPGGPPWRRWLEESPGSQPLPWLTSFAVLVVQQVGSQAAEGNQEALRLPLDGYARLLLTVGPLLLVLRHRRPRTVVFGTVAATLLYFGAGYPYGPVFLSVAVACFAAVVAGHRCAAWSALGMLWAGHLLVGHWLYRWLPPAGDGPPGWGQELLVAAWVAAILAAAELARVRREEWARRTGRARRRPSGAAPTRSGCASPANCTTSSRTASRSSTSRRAWASRCSTPTRNRPAPRSPPSRRASKEALGEVRQVLDTLRAPGAAPRAPAPGLDRLPELAEQAADAGLDGDARAPRATAVPLPPGADLAAFRIVQEALTNVVRHSGIAHRRASDCATGRASCSIRRRRRRPGRRSGGASGGGNGLVGMRERAAALGGSVEAGPRDGRRLPRHRPLPARSPAVR